MTTDVHSMPEPPAVRPVAPWWHTTLLVAMLVGLALAGALFQRNELAKPPVTPSPTAVLQLYLSLIAMEWALIYYVWKVGLRRTGTSLRELIGGRWGSARDVAVDVALGLLVWGVWTAISWAWDRWLGPGQAASVAGMLPRSALQIGLWIGVSTSAGIAEELVFRGYFQRQFEASTHSRWVAWLLQAALFGISHGYQGVVACMKIAVFGALFGLLAMRRGSLRPGMIGHAWTDVAAGIFRL